MLFYRLCILNIFVLINELDDLNLLILCVWSDKISHFSRYVVWLCTLGTLERRVFQIVLSDKMSHLNAF